MPVIRLLLTPLWDATTYARWVYMVIGGTVFLPYLLATLVLASMFATPATPGPQGADPGFLALALIPAVLLVAASAWIPGARSLEGHVTHALLRGPIAAEHITESASWRSRARTGLWLALHLVLGFGVALATMVGLTEAAALAATPFATDHMAIAQGPLTFFGSSRPTGALRWLAPLIGLGLLLALVYTTALIGWGMARLAPRLLGPSTAERLAAAQERADHLAERNRLARELHDSIGHALSVVALQSGTAARVLDSDPDFARHALEAIAEQARTATAELDHVLGLLREERPTAATPPQRGLSDLQGLIEATRAIGGQLTAHVDGDVHHVPAVVSRETYRICQEGITNALRHGGKVPITLHVTIEPERLSVEVTNPHTPASSPLPRPALRRGGGHGLAGLHERLRILGGRLQAGPHDGHWRLRAEISWGQAR
ncbi:histidine kinase [Nocardiopsis gilva YIM 90087]|uniref:histidine kinase n=1 Tax=Nocardiopsis gilva YIM 90087 TaxID=1235441 RepID=A0A223S713_9ACTN|nr:histidine kinase [Nocardiopsis gilva]ASU83924.1 histidine kinase [Nocardiopsis gilva YIM 90087]